jgi:nitroreductase
MNNYSITEVIRRRSSWRSFDAISPIPSRNLSQIKDYLNNSDCIGPFGNRARFQLIKTTESERSKLNSEYGTYGFIKGAEYFLAGAIPQNHMALVDYGYIFEHIILKVTELNLGTCWLGGSFKRSAIAKEINLQDGEIIPAISPIGIPSQNRRFIGKIIRLAIRAKKRKPWQELFFRQSFTSLIPEDLDESYRTAFEMIRLGPSAKNKQPWRIILDNTNKVHFFIEKDSRTGKALNYQKLDIGIAMCHFELTIRTFQNNGKWISSPPNFNYNDEIYDYVTSWTE